MERVELAVQVFFRFGDLLIDIGVRVREADVGEFYGNYNETQVRCMGENRGQKRQDDDGTQPFHSVNIMKSAIKAKGR